MDIESISSLADLGSATYCRTRLSTHRSAVGRSVTTVNRVSCRPVVDTIDRWSSDPWRHRASGCDGARPGGAHGCARERVPGMPWPRGGPRTWAPGLRPSAPSSDGARPGLTDDAARAGRRTVDDGTEGKEVLVVVMMPPRAGRTFATRR